MYKSKKEKNNIMNEQNKPIDITNLSVQELKSLAYDIIVQINQHQVSMNQLNADLRVLTDQINLKKEVK